VSLNKAFMFIFLSILSPSNQYHSFVLIKLKYPISSNSKTFNTHYKTSALYNEHFKQEQKNTKQKNCELDKNIVLLLP